MNFASARLLLLLERLPVSNKFGFAEGNASSVQDDRSWTSGSSSGFAKIVSSTLGLRPFPTFVNTFVRHPIPWLPVAVGENSTSGSTSTVFWEYNRFTGMHLEAQPGYLTTSTGNGGFTLDVRTDGSWVLHFTGSHKTSWYDAEAHVGSGADLPSPPTGNTTVFASLNGDTFLDATVGHVTSDGRGSPTNPVVGLDTVQGGVGDYMIGGTGAHLETPTGNDGNCAIYTLSAAPVLADVQNGNGYGGNAEGNSYVNIDQVRGSLSSNVLIGSANGTDLKSGGANSILVSTGGKGYELRPDGSNTTLVSTAGADRVLFDPAHGWALGDTATLIGFNPSHGVLIDLSLIGSTFHTAGSTGNLNDYVKLSDGAGGEKMLFSATGNVGSAGVDVLNIPLVHGYTAQSLYDSHNLTI